MGLSADTDEAALRGARTPESDNQLRLECIACHHAYSPALRECPACGYLTLWTIEGLGRSPPGIASPTLGRWLIIAILMLAAVLATMIALTA